MEMAEFGRMNALSRRQFLANLTVVSSLAPLVLGALWGPFVRSLRREEPDASFAASRIMPMA